MKIGIVGLGVVGTACFEGFRDIGNDVVGHDIKFNSKLEDLIDVEIIYMCAPHPQIVMVLVILKLWSRLLNLHELKFDGIVAIKSTVEPGFTQKLMRSTQMIKFVLFLNFYRDALRKILNYGSLIIGSANSNINEKIMLVIEIFIQISRQ